MSFDVKSVTFGIHKNVWKQIDAFVSARERKLFAYLFFIIEIEPGERWAIDIE